MAGSGVDGPLGDLDAAVMFLAACVLAVPVAYGLAVAATTWWYETRYLPTIAGDE